ncbi:MAG: DUF1002 domain-containing protein [Oscillospiraceae bacterium]|nr:DUF1002 domain-containing protein [Oscillospiraceae bacterium]
MFKRFIGAVLAFLFILGAASTAFAMDEGDWRIVFGADLTDEERASVYEVFGVEPEGLEERRILTVTNSEERFYFEGKLPDNEIGYRSISSIYIRALPAGSGLSVRTVNINYCTAEMYESVLSTVGITDAEIIVAAPRPVSGTAALTGIYKAYESLTGRLISEYAKEAGVEELLTTGELAAMLGTEEATEVIVELKKILDVTQHMSDGEVMDAIRSIAEENEIELTDEQIRQILVLLRTLEGLDVEQIRRRAFGLVEAASGWDRFTEGVRHVVVDLGEFFREVAQFLHEAFDRFFSERA